MQLPKRIRSLCVSYVNEALNGSERLAGLEAQMAEMAERLRALAPPEQQIAGVAKRVDLLSPNVLTPQEEAHLTRYRMERGLLANWSDNPQELVDRAQAVLAKLRPMRAIGAPKARFGSRHDGGYVILNDFEPLDRLLSFGVEQNAEFDLAFAERNIEVVQFDHTIERALYSMLE